jgi:hypothetical protein
MNKLFLPIPMLLLLILSCKSPDKPATIVKKEFHIPVFVQRPSETAVTKLEIPCLNEDYFKFVGKHKFSDTIVWNNDHDWEDAISANDYLREKSRPEDDDSLSTDGFQIFPDYKTSVYYKHPLYDGPYWYFPVYIVNETSSTKVFYGKDSHAFGIQEAIDTTDWSRWRPIEGRGFDFCGNGDFGVKVHPGEFVMLLVHKYQGNEKEAIRIRLSIGESLYISRSYIGTFSAKQFEIDKRSFIYRHLKDSKDRHPFDLFYGAIPKGYDAN